MAGSRLERKFAEAFACYDGEPADVREAFEQHLQAALELLSGDDRLSPATKSLMRDAIVMSLIEGYVGGEWSKVHQALARTRPSLYERVKKSLPSASGDHPLAL
jgi:hypothetical protein